MGNELDSVMNYPFRDAIIDFIKTKNPHNIFNTVLNICENYPKPVLNNLMNMLSTHDTERIFTVISSITNTSKEECLNVMKSAVALQYTLPGVPSVYYGDEAGLEGGKDPFCRKCYPWGRENKDLLEFFKQIGKFRKKCACLKTGKFTPVFIDDETFSFKRESSEDILFCSFCFNDNKNIPKFISKEKGLTFLQTFKEKYFSLFYFKK